ncbi:MAG: hypothetical protein RI914_539 [Pseudomonadota bacterium]|jgi:hypothetical protein
MWRMPSGMPQQTFQRHLRVALSLVALCLPRMQT